MTSLLAAGSPFDTFAGLPLHTLVVHLVVVLLPVVALAGIAMAVRAGWSRRIGAVTVVGALVATGAAYVAGKSGELLQSRVDAPAIATLHQQIAAHALVGRQVKYVAAGLLVLVALLWWQDRRSADGGRRTTPVLALAALTVVGSAAAIGWTVRAGDSGARAVWQTTIQHTKPGTYPVQH